LNVAEELAGSFLKEVLDCDFVEYNLQMRFIQGEIDVVGINLDKKRVYFCEVAAHLTTGLRYTKNNQPNNVKKLIQKFENDIEYADKFFKKYDKVFMFWSPIIKIPRKQTKHNQLKDLNKVHDHFQTKHNVSIIMVTLDDFLDCIEELRKISLARTDALTNPIMRFLQIEEKLKKELNLLEKAMQWKTNREFVEDGTPFWKDL